MKAATTEAFGHLDDGVRQLQLTLNCASALFGGKETEANGKQSAPFHGSNLMWCAEVGLPDSSRPSRTGGVAPAPSRVQRFQRQREGEHRRCCLFFCLG